jgi:hypothetical protein
VAISVLRIALEGKGERLLRYLRVQVGEGPVLSLRINREIEAAWRQHILGLSLTFIRHK